MTSDSELLELCEKCIRDNFWGITYHNAVTPQRIKALLEDKRRLEDTLVHIEEYWNGANESAVDAAEECKHSAQEALKEVGDE